MQVQLQLMFDEKVELLPGLVTLESSDKEWDKAMAMFEATDRFALDIETMKWTHPWEETDKDALVPFRNKVRLIQVGLSANKCIIVDLGGIQDDRDVIAKNPRVIEFFKVLHEQCFSYDTEVVGHNLYFESSVLNWHYGIKIRKPTDTMRMSQMIYAGCSGKYDNIRHSLAAVIQRELGETPDKSQGKAFDWRLPLSNKQLNYAMNDVYYPLRLADKMLKYIKSTTWYFSYRVESAVIPILAETYVKGYPVDIDRINKAVEQYEQLKEHVLSPFKEQFPDVAPTATTEKLIACFNKAGLDIKYVGSKSKDGLDLDFQEYIKDHKKHPLVEAIIHWRTYEKHQQYLKNMQKSYIKGAVHGYYNVWSPKGTGRTTCGANISHKNKAIASTGINLQNPAKPLYGKLGKDIPKEIGIDELISIRSCFRHPDKDYRLLIEDLPQAHMMIATMSSQDQVLIRAYNEKQDQHALVGATLAQIAGYDWDWEYIKANKDSCPKCYKFRHGGKTMNYSALNLAGIARISQANGVTEQEARTMKEGHVATFPQLHSFLKKLVWNANNLIRKNDHRLEYLKRVNPYTSYGIARSFDGRELIMKKYDGLYGESVNASESTAFHWLACEATIN